MLEFKIGNILDATENIICHQVNCRGGMGSGLAKQLRNRFPTLFSHYKEFVDKQAHNGLLGYVDLADVGINKYVANLFGQDKYGIGEIQTSYPALRKSLHETFKFADDHNLSVAIPYKLGCGLAGGDWAKVLFIITDLVTDFIKVDVAIYILQ